MTAPVFVRHLSSSPCVNFEIPKSDDLDHRGLTLLVGQEDVVRLEVAVNDPFAVCRVQRLQGWLHHRAGRTQAERSDALEQARQTLAFQVLHDQERLALRGHPDVEYLDDVLVANGRRCLRFAMKAPYDVLTAD